MGLGGSATLLPRLFSLASLQSFAPSKLLLAKPFDVLSQAPQKTNTEIVVSNFAALASYHTCLFVSLFLCVIFFF